MTSRDTLTYRRDAAAKGSLLSVEEREALLRKYLPAQEDDGPWRGEDGPVSGDDDDASSPSSIPRLTKANNTKSIRRKPIRSFVKTQLFVLVFGMIQIFFGIYMRLRRVWRGLKSLALRVLYHHHRTPELIQGDVAGLSRLPKHLSILLELPDEGCEVSNSARTTMRKRMRSRRNKRINQERKRWGQESNLANGAGHNKDAEEQALGSNGIEGLGYTVEVEAILDDIAELASWSSAAGIPVLSIYERRGVLKEMIPGVHAAVKARLTAYFGSHRCPTLQVRAPHMPSYLDGDNEDESVLPAAQDPHLKARTVEDVGGGVGGGKHFEYDSSDGGGDDGGNKAGREGRSRDDAADMSPSSSSKQQQQQQRHLDLLLLSEDDGRPTMVDLTKTLAEMSQKGKLSPRDVGLDLIEQELIESYGAGEPDLLMLFGDRIVLRGYPPWQLRLTEIFCAGEGGDKAGGGGGSVDYHTWLRGLYGFAKAEMRLGR